jgi:dipeptidase
MLTPTRRVWRIFSLVAPSLDLPGHTDYYGNDYPFSVKTEKLLTALDLMDLQRDHYEGKRRGVLVWSFLRFTHIHILPDTRRH